MTKGRLAVVTGGASGIGRATALALASDGYSVAVLDRTLADPDALSQELLATGAATAACYRFDLAMTQDHAGMVERVERELGAIDVLVNNAGVPARVRGDLLDITPENFDAALDVNLRGTFFLTQEVARRMLSRTDAPAGRAIVVVSSVSATMASVERAEYCLSKAALPMLVKLFALRLAESGIGVFEVRPGIIRTPMTDKVSERYDGLIRDGLVPALRWGEGADVAAAVRALADGTLNFSTGSVISVDGGVSIKVL